MMGEALKIGPLPIDCTEYLQQVCVGALKYSGVLERRGPTLDRSTFVFEHRSSPMWGKHNVIKHAGVKLS